MGSVGELTASTLEQAARVDLAAAFRLAVRLDLHEGVCNHFSAMLADGRGFITVASHVATVPGLTVFLAVLGLNILGEGLREVLDPRTR